MREPSDSVSRPLCAATDGLQPTFLNRYPNVQLEFKLSEDTRPLINKGFDVGIRVAAMQDAGYVARPLGPLRLPPCAAPSYLQKHGVPKSLDALVSTSHTVPAPPDPSAEGLIVCSAASGTPQHPSVRGLKTRSLSSGGASVCFS
jgi:DNA-binding transcriptional LysR family regulator